MCEQEISDALQTFPQPSMVHLPSYIWDTTDFINELRRLPIFQPGCLLVTLDVSLLYTNIPHEEGIVACEEFLNLWESQVHVPTAADLCHLLQLILSTNSFIFNNIHHLRIHGTPMHTCMAPSYANLFMGKLEHEFLWTQDKIPQVWWRYIDDIFAIWTLGEPSLRVFSDSLNCYNPTIKFIATWSAEQVTFLDTRVFLK